MTCKICGSDDIEVFEYSPAECYGARCNDCGALYERKYLNLLNDF